MVQVDWKGKMRFDVTPPSGVRFTLDSRPEFGGEGMGPTPTEAMFGALAACTAMDVVSILEKKRQTITSYRIEVEGERPPEGEFPRPYTHFRVKHILTGPNLDPVAVARAIELSDEKYCTVMATLRDGARVSTSWEIEARETVSGIESGPQRTRG